MALISDDTRSDKLQSLLDTTFSELRDQNFVSDSAILVYDEAAEEITEVPLMKLPLLFPCYGKGARWSYDDLGRVIAGKAAGYRQSVIANDIADDESEASPPCSTMLLWLTDNYRPYKRLRITANIKPGQ